MAEILHDVFIYSDARSIFEAVSQAEKINNWWTLKCSGSAQLATQYNFYFTDEYDWFGEVHSVEIGKHIHWLVTKADEDWTNTIFGFDLVALEENKTQVKFKHILWDSANDHFRRTSYCWAMLLSLLKDYVESGHVVPYEKRTFT